MDPSQQLAEWLDDCSRGDRVAFASLYKQTSGHLFSLSLRILNRRDWAEEALQDAYLKIWNHAGDYNPERGRAFTWMATIVRNRCLDQWRKVHREPVSKEALREDLNWCPKPETSSPDAQAIQKCLKDLSQEERDSILLAYWKGFTQREISAHWDRPLGTVKTWVRRGLEKLKGCLNP